MNFSQFLRKRKIKVPKGFINPLIDALSDGAIVVKKPNGGRIIEFLQKEGFVFISSSEIATHSCVLNKFILEAPPKWAEIWSDFTLHTEEIMVIEGVRIEHFNKVLRKIIGYERYGVYAQMVWASTAPLKEVRERIIADVTGAGYEWREEYYRYFALEHLKYEDEDFEESL